MSPMQKQFWINKGLTEEQAIYKIRTFRKLNIEYWISRGSSESEALLKVKEFQKENVKKCNEKRKKDPKKYAGILPVQLQYWLNKGLSEEEAKKALQKRQQTFTLEKCIKKYGKIDGQKKWQERQDKWKSTLKNKSFEEIEKINKKKDSASFNHFFNKFNNFETAYDNYIKSCKSKDSMSINYYMKKFKISYNEAKILQNERIKLIVNSFGKAAVSRSKNGYSKMANKIFDVIFKFLIEKGYSSSDEILYSNNIKEYAIKYNNNCNCYLYDFTILNLKLIFEFNGIKFHPDYRLNESEIQSWRSLYNKNITGVDVIKKDRHKKQIAEENGFKLIELWQLDGNEKNINIAIESINELIKSIKI